MGLSHNVINQPRQTESCCLTMLRVFLMCLNWCGSVLLRSWPLRRLNHMEQGWVDSYFKLHCILLLCILHLLLKCCFCKMIHCSTEITAVPSDLIPFQSQWADNKWTRLLPYLKTAAWLDLQTPLNSLTNADCSPL